MASIYDTLTEPTPDYTAKMLHRVPTATVVDRMQYIVDHCRGKRVLNLGCASGELHGHLRDVASDVVGVDKNPPADQLSDLDEVAHLMGTYDLVVMGEILEHLSNPGNALRAVRELRCPVIITVPNCFSLAARGHMKDGIENVNKDHVAWYSYHTLKHLVERYRFTVKDWHWYNGPPITAEGLIFLVE